MVMTRQGRCVAILFIIVYNAKTLLNHPTVCRLTISFSLKEVIIKTLVKNKFRIINLILFYFQAV